jgi:hypothetical protein
MEASSLKLDSRGSVRVGGGKFNREFVSETFVSLKKSKVKSLIVSYSSVSASNGSSPTKEVLCFWKRRYSRITAHLIGLVLYRKQISTIKDMSSDCNLFVTEFPVPAFATGSAACLREVVVEDVGFELLIIVIVQVKIRYKFKNKII